MKTERKQIHFLSDVLVAVASLDLKVPIRDLRSEDGDGDGSVNVAEKVNSRSFSLHHDYSKSLTLSNVGEPS